VGEVVLRISAASEAGGDRLGEALEAFARWAEEAVAPGEDSPSVFVLTERTCGESSRKLVFDTFESASRFLGFLGADGPLEAIISGARATQGG